MSLRHAILGLLATGPMSGYDLRKEMAARMAHVWTADQAQIYRSLAALVEDGCVTVETVAQDGRPDRRVHRLLARGARELDDWLATELRDPPVRNSFLLRLYNGERLADGDLRALLTVRIGAARRQVATLSGMVEAMRATDGRGRAARLKRASVAHALAHARAELAWAQALYDEIARP